MASSAAVEEIPVNPPRRPLLLASISLIVLHWIYQLVGYSSPPVIPEHFPDLVRQIIVNKLVMIIVLSVLLRLEPGGWAGVGVSRREWPRHVGRGVLIGLAMFIGLNVILTAVVEAVLPRPAAGGPSILSFFVDWRNLLVWLPIGIFGGGVIEELERVFVITRFEQWLGRKGLVIGVVITSLMFGAGHLYQGLGAALSTAVSGLVFALVFLRRRSAVEAMAAHAFSDVLAMIAGAIMAH